MYGAEQQILEEEIKTELECQNESLRVSGWVAGCCGGAGDTDSMQNMMIENFLFIICGLITVTKYIIQQYRQASHHSNID